jgi:hypothetical protein
MRQRRKSQTLLLKLRYAMVIGVLGKKKHPNQFKVTSYVWNVFPMKLFLMMKIETSMGTYVSIVFKKNNVESWWHVWSGDW